MDGRRAAKTRKDLGARIAQDAMASVRRDNPRAYQLMGIQLLGKQLGVEVDASLLKDVDDGDDDKGWEERLIRKKMRDDPEYREKYLKAVMEAKFGKKREPN